MIAKIAMQAADLYADAYSSMQVGSVKNMWEKVSKNTLNWYTQNVNCTHSLYLFVGLVADSKCKAVLLPCCGPTPTGIGS